MKSKHKHSSSPSLFQKFQPGDRVTRSLNKDSRSREEYEGIIMAMDSDYLEIYWDIKNGSYCPNSIEEDFTKCLLDEVCMGNLEFSPIKRKKPSLNDTHNYY
jgi:hypothetical protein